MTSQGKEDLTISKMAPRPQLEFVGEGADVTGKGEDFSKFQNGVARISYWRHLWDV